MTLLIVRSMFTRWSPKTVMRLAWEPTDGTWMYVPLSLIIDLTSSSLSVNSQSSLRGRMAVSLEMTNLLYAQSANTLATLRINLKTHLLHRDVEQHVSRTLYPKELSCDPDLVRFAQFALLAAMDAQTWVGSGSEWSYARSTRWIHAVHTHPHVLRLLHSHVSAGSDVWVMLAIGREGHVHTHTRCMSIMAR